jgi:hypothetical protein
VEVNLFRRLANPGFPPLGLSETLNDLVPSIDTQRIVFSESFSEFSELRQDLNNPLRALFSEDLPKVSSFSGMSTALPENISILTFKPKDCCSSTKMVRLQNTGEATILVPNLTRIFGVSNITHSSLNFISTYEPTTSATIESHMIRGYLLTP